MELNVKVKSYEELSYKYLALWNEGLNLTGTEMKLASLLIASYMRLVDDGLKDPYLTKFLFGSENKRKLHSEFTNKGGNKITDQRYRALFKALVEKKVLVEKEENYQIVPIYLPKKKIVFNFKLEEG